MVKVIITIIFFLLEPIRIHCFASPRFHKNVLHNTRDVPLLSTNVNNSPTETAMHPEEIFHDFIQFLKSHQTSMIDEIEHIDGSDEKFSFDAWGTFDSDSDGSIQGSGGITRVLQNGLVVEKGACSLTVIQSGKLTKERAETISARQESLEVGEGDIYSAAALSVVLHTRNPFVPVSSHFVVLCG